KTKPGAWEYDIVYPAYKCNMTDIMASLGIGQLQRYPLILARRKQIIEMYDRALLGCNVAILNHYGHDFSSSGHLYLTRLLGTDETYRNIIIEKMSEKGIPTNVHYKPLPMHSAYKRLGFDIKDYPNAFNMYKNEITLPLHTLLTDAQIEHIADSLKSVVTVEFLNFA
ncbi:MAG: DegT/DnrJ/EryC1/StrS family aminotransferase, partial [Bacillota bacterium]